ncbi:cysteine proteinase [Auriculariales sp. MPI-PUGE-AT-0066]|nr:cysteine proteinase [Auriculariales sp. MPI-PUGE-AT-0066]
MSSISWVPLESDPQVLTDWAKKAGLATRQYAFSDIFGLDEGLLAMVPRPVQAVLLVFPITDALETARKEVDARISVEGGQPAVDPTIIFIKQTIGNACGTIALLHAILNTEVTLGPGSALSKFQDAVMNKTPTERGKLLEQTSIFATIHSEMAKQGQSEIPRDNKTDLHYVAFVLAPEPPAGDTTGQEARTDSPGLRLIELDGRRPVPVDHGPAEEGSLLEAVANVVKETYVGKSSSLQFSMIALAPPPPDDF